MSKRGFTKTSNRALFDPRLTMADKAVYAMLLHLAWLHRPERAEGDVVGKAVPLPASHEIAVQMGVSDSAFRRHLSRLRRLGYVETSRASRREPMLYVVHASPPPSDQTQDAPSPPPSERTQSASKRADLRARGLFSSSEDGKSEEGAFGSALERATPDGSRVDWELAGDPPMLKRDEFNQSMAFNTLAEVCGVRLSSPRVTEVARALSGEPSNLDRAPGINRMFWFEVALATGRTMMEVRLRATENPMGYQEKLSEMIRRKATMYRSKLEGASLTPLALAKWWMDVEIDPAGTTSTGDRVMTSDEMRSWRG